jgi:hypothetical protein
MPGPRATERRRAEFNPDSLEKGTKITQEVESSKREGLDKGKAGKGKSTRIDSPTSGRSGSDSNASRRTRGG